MGRAQHALKPFPYPKFLNLLLLPGSKLFASLEEDARPLR